MAAQGRFIPLRDKHPTDLVVGHIPAFQPNAISDYFDVLATSSSHCFGYGDRAKWPGSRFHHPRDKLPSVCIHEYALPYASYLTMR